MKDHTYKPLDYCRENKLRIDFVADPPTCKPRVLGRINIDDIPLETIAERIDWNPFSYACQIRGTYPNSGFPKLFNCPTVGQEAKKLFDDAQRMIKSILSTKAFGPRAVVSLFPANAVGDDIEVY